MFYKDTSDYLTMIQKGKRYFKWIACVAALLLLWIAGSQAERFADDSYSTSTTPVCHEPVATLSIPHADLCDTLYEANRLGIPATPLHLHASTGRTLSWGDTQQHIGRLLAILLGWHIILEELSHTRDCEVASLRFRIGYFIYHHCQMRC